MKNCHTRTCLLATLIASTGLWASPLGGHAQEAMETPPAASDATVPTSAAAPSSVAPGPMLEARQKLLARIAAAKAQGIGIAAYQSAFDYNEETIKSGHRNQHRQAHPGSQHLSRRSGQAQYHAQDSASCTASSGIIAAALGDGW